MKMYEYGGQMFAKVNSIYYRRSPVPRGGLEIPVKLIIKEGEAKNQFGKMITFMEENCTEPNQIPVIATSAADSGANDTSETDVDI